MPSFSRINRVKGSGISPIQLRLAIAVSICSVAYLGYLLTAKASPQLGAWAGPPHLSSSVLLALAVSTVLSAFVAGNSLLGWWTIVTSTAIIIGFEFLQLLTPNRAFQFLDIAEGIAGAAIAAMFAVVIIKVIGRSVYVWLALAVVVAVLIGSLLLLRIDKPVPDIDCVQPISKQVNWDLVSVDTFSVSQQDKSLVSTSIGSLCFFNPDTSPTENLLKGRAILPTGKNHNLILNGTGLVSAELTGLRQALSASGEITFGIRFKAGTLEAGRPPRLIASLQSVEQPLSPVARLIQNGPNATAAFSFRPWQGSSTVLANRLSEQFHEVILTYDGTMQTTYFDGVPVGTETTNIKSIEPSEAELFLTIGRRTDGRWQPFVGEIDAIVVGARSISDGEVATIFQHD